MTKEDDKNVDTTTGTEQKVDSTASSSVVVGKVSNNKLVFWRDWTKKRWVVFLIICFVFIAATATTGLLVLFSNKDAVVPTVDTSSTQYIDAVTGKNSTKGDQIVAKKDATTVLKSGSSATDVTQSDVKFSSVDDATTKASLYYDAGEYGKSLEVYLVADSMQGTKTYVFYERVGITAKLAGNKSVAVQYFQKAKTALSARTGLEASVVSGGIAYYDDQIKELSK